MFHINYDIELTIDINNELFPLQYLFSQFDWIVIPFETKIKQYCETKSNMPYYETSAKDNTNVEAAFEQVAKLAFQRNSKEDEIFIPNRVELKTTNQQTQQKQCC